MAPSAIAATMNISIDIDTVIGHMLAIPRTYHLDPERVGAVADVAVQMGVV